MATSAQGTVFKFTPQGGEQVAVGKLTSVGEITPTSEPIDVTTLDSEGGFREYMQGFRDSGEVALSGFYEKGSAGQSALRTAYESGFPGAAEVQFADGTLVRFSALVKSYTLGAAEVNGAVGFGAVLKLTGGVTVTETEG